MAHIFLFLFEVVSGKKVIQLPLFYCSICGEMTTEMTAELYRVLGILAAKSVINDATILCLLCFFCCFLLFLLFVGFLLFLPLFVMAQSSLALHFESVSMATKMTVAGTCHILSFGNIAPFIVSSIAVSSHSPHCNGKCDGLYGGKCACSLCLRSVQLK